MTAPPSDGAGRLLHRIMLFGTGKNLFGAQDFTVQPDGLREWLAHPA